MKKKKQSKDKHYNQSASNGKVVEILVTPGSALIMPVPLSVRINIEEKRL